MVLRAGTAADIVAMFALDQLCFEPPFTFDLRSMRRYATARNAIVVLAEEAADLAGFVILNLKQKGSVAYVSTLDVHPNHRRHGLARVLMTQAESHAQAAGARVAALHVYAGNEPAIRFYQSLGYTQTASEPDYYGPTFEAHTYTKSFNPLPG